jgi:hypothetical protein
MYVRINEEGTRDRTALDLPVVLTKRSNKKLAQGERYKMMKCEHNIRECNSMCNTTMSQRGTLA